MGLSVEMSPKFRDLLRKISYKLFSLVLESGGDDVLEVLHSVGRQHRLTEGTDSGLELLKHA
jgi:hypothetical protein